MSTTFNSLVLSVAGCAVIGLVFLMRASLNIQATHDTSLTTWLRMHPPKKVSHDAELLRRRMLGQLAEAGPRELSAHVPAILASLDHSDDHVRRLASSMLSRLEPRAVMANIDGIAEKLASSDAQVRLHVTQALGYANSSNLAPFADQPVDCLTDADASVRWAAVDALSALHPQVLANRTIRALDKLMAQQELSLAKAAVSAWASKLERDAPQVMEEIGRLNFRLNFGGATAGGGDILGGLE